jgi:hypothetical protein
MCGGQEGSAVSKTWRFAKRRLQNIMRFPKHGALQKEDFKTSCGSRVM